MLHDDLKKVWKVLKLDVPTGEKAKMLNLSEGDFRKINGKWCSFDPEYQPKPRTYVNGELYDYGLVRRSKPPAHKGVDLRKHAYLA